jgi:hypothetical protein
MMPELSLVLLLEQGRPGSSCSRGMRVTAQDEENHAIYRYFAGASCRTPQMRQNTRYRSGN